MHLHFERTVNAKSDCSILSVTWMGKVPDELPEDEGWKLNRTNYYQEGWLATGNVRGIVGVTFTTSHCKKNVDFPLRTNYNLRGHRSEVILVKWNEPYQKLASCDSSGIIFVWIKYEGRWSIELINDRNTPVTHFSWSHDGRMALICYQDGFVLVGSVAGQRYWSSMLNLSSTISAGIWTPDDQQVYLGTAGGQVIVMDVHGAMVSQVQLATGVESGIQAMAWSCEKFKMEESEDQAEPGVHRAAERKFVLAVLLTNGNIYLMKTYDDVSPVLVETGLQGPLCIEWSNSRELLAVSGLETVNTRPGHLMEYTNVLKFYNERGGLVYVNVLPYTQAPVSALTWGHNDKRLFLATGTHIHIAWVSRRIPTLQLLCRLKIHDLMLHESQLALLPLPLRIRNLIGNLFAQTIRCCVPEPSALREFVSRPPNGSVRLHCTMIRHDDDSNLSSGTCYTLYLEYLGGLVPLLKGKRTSKIRPEFVIFDPQVEDFQLQWSPESTKSSSSQSTSGSGGILSGDSSASDREEGCTSSPRMHRRSKRRRRFNSSKVPQQDRPPGTMQNNNTDAESEDLAYLDTLPEHVRLVEVTSNIWGTKFKIHGLASTLPANLGQVTYKTSLLHLQPRQMTLVMTELCDDLPTGPDPAFNPTLFSEDEEDGIKEVERIRCRRPGLDDCPPIAPMSPRGVRGAMIKNATCTTAGEKINIPYIPSEGGHTSAHPALVKTESYEDESEKPSISLNLKETVRPQNLTSICTTHSLRSTSSLQSTSFIGSHFNHRTSSTSNQSPNQRHAISPLCCEGAVPALQSPKNAVAPSDIIFDRPPAQTLISYPNNEYSVSNNLQQVKSAMADHHHQASELLLKKMDSIGFSKMSGKLNNNSGSRCNNQVLTRQEIIAAKNCKKGVINGHILGSASKDIAFVDDDTSQCDVVPGTSSLSSSIPRPSPGFQDDSMVRRSCSVGYLDMVDIHLASNDVALQLLRNKDPPKRLILVNKKHQRPNKKQQSSNENVPKPLPDDLNKNITSSSNLKHSGKSRSLDSSEIFPDTESRIGVNKIITIVDEGIPEEPPKEKSLISSTSSSPSEHSDESTCQTKKECSKLSFFVPRSPLMRRNKNKSNNSETKNEKGRSSRSKHKGKDKEKNNIENSHQDLPFHSQALANLERLITRLREDDSGKSTPIGSPRLPRSSPASPAPSKKGKRPQSASPIRKNILSSPLLGRRSKKNKNYQESSDDEVTASGDEICNGTNYKDLETFQKAQLRQKLKRGKIEPNGSSCNNHVVQQRREFVMHNKAPMWNENSQVYQLDFGGRVTQESAKNFQIEFRGKQVMQFGRIDGNAYTLDFQYPFSALQAFAVALANVTQRLK